MTRFAIFLILGLATATAAAEPVRYVSDDLVITMRTGQGSKFQIIQQLRSGIRLEILEEDGNYAKVRTPNGKEGWVLSQYLSDQPIARHKLAAAESKLQAVREKHGALQDKMRDLGSENQQLKTERTRLTQEKNKLEMELENLRKLAARPAQLSAENERMRDQISALQAEAKRLADTNTDLKDRSQRDWFLAGAGVLGGGVFLGLVLPLLRRRRKSGFDLR